MIHKIHACFFSLEMKTTKRSDPSASAIPFSHNFLQRKYTFSSLQNHNKIITCARKQVFDKYETSAACWIIKVVLALYISSFFVYVLVNAIFMNTFYTYFMQIIIAAFKFLAHKFVDPIHAIALKASRFY